jgi:hypothetical protein
LAETNFIIFLQTSQNINELKLSKRFNPSTNRVSYLISRSRKRSPKCTARNNKLFYTLTNQSGSTSVSYRFILYQWIMIWLQHIMPMLIRNRFRIQYRIRFWRPKIVKCFRW